ncbi:MBL fold metallo-hydrolase [Luteimicrobium sp. DT211]|uniref:MBL fold metallo-hydrolase n=1 Tax=Luteimicrobium sp. DT211 TaxID=3393412 RepID=UPI003CF56811
MLTLDDLVLRQLAVGPMNNDAYLLTCRATGAQLLVDAAAEPDRLLALVREGSPDGRLDVVVTTHGHRDHLGALAEVAGATGAVAAAGEDDAAAITAATGVAVNRLLHHGDRLRLGQVELAVVGLRGHTPGPVALAYTEPGTASAPDAVPGRTHLFTGDSLFPGGVGSTQHDPQRFARLHADVVARVFDVYRDDTVVLPGHGLPTTLGAERPHLEEWRERGW